VCPGRAAIILEQAEFGIESDDVAGHDADIRPTAAVLDEVVSEGVQIPVEIRALNAARQMGKVVCDD